MSIAAISNAVAYQPPEPISRRHQEDIDGRQLASALQSGDLAGAQQAYNELSAFGRNSSGPFGSAALNRDFKSVGQAIQAGDLAGAQQSFRTFANDVLMNDIQIVGNDVRNGNLAAAQQAVANFQGDFWAAHGSSPRQPSTAATASGSDVPPTTTINAQA